MQTDARETRSPVGSRVPPWVWDIIAGALVVAAAFMPFTSPEFRPSSGLVLAVMVLPAFLLPLRRRWPIPILAACIACYGFAAWGGTVAPGTVLAASVAMFGVATRTTRRTTIVTGCVAVLAITGLSLISLISEVFDPRTFQFAVTVAFAAAAGDATRSRREYIQAITDRALRAEQTREAEAQRRVSVERLRIARDLHDAVAHQISVISLNAGVASSSLESRPDKTREALATIRNASRTVLSEIGMLLTMLRADDADADADANTVTETNTVIDTNTVAVPQPGVGQLGDLLGTFRESGLEVGLRIDGDLPSLPPGTDIVAYRVIQEALTNAHKHGAEHRAHVLIVPRADSLQIVVTNPVDHATGVDATSNGLGLIGLRERVAAVGGSVQIGHAPGGFRLDATLPLAPLPTTTVSNS